LSTDSEWRRAFSASRAFFMSRAFIMIAPRAASPSGTAVAAPPKAAATAEPAAQDRSRPIGVLDPNWNCPWPAEAESQGIDEQVAVVRVTVRPNGSAETVRVVSDPGSGFGCAAVSHRCLR